MSKEMTTVVLGVWIVVVPYLGIPGSWRTALLVFTGIGVAVIGFFLRSEALSRSVKKSPRHPFIENTFIENTLVGSEDNPEHEHKEGINSLN